MKRLVLFLIKNFTNRILVVSSFIILSSCGMNEIEKLVAEYEQTFGDSKLDLKFKPIKTTFVKNITGADSAKFYQDFYDSSFNAHIQERLLVIQDLEEYLEEWIEKRNNSGPYLRKIYDSTISDWEERLIGLNERLEIAKNNPDDLFNDEWLEKKKGYESKPDEILCLIYDVEYKIFNPFLQSDQTVKNRYYISSNKSSILEKDDK